jgi:hypothetical protein
MIFRRNAASLLLHPANPNLQQPDRFILRRIEFAMFNAAAGGYILQVSLANDATVAHRIVVLQLAAQNVSHDFHVAMRMRAEARSGHHEVVVDDAQAAKTHPLRIVIISETESVISIEPAITVRTK